VCLRAILAFFILPDDKKRPYKLGTTSRQSLFFIEKSKRSSQFQNNQDGRFDVRNNQDGRFASLLIKTVASILLIIKTVVRINSFNQDGRKLSKIIKTVVLQY